MSTVDWVLLTNDAVKAGDLVSADAGGMPIYRVVAIEGGRAWLQGDGHPAIQTMPLDHFHWRAAAPQGGLGALCGLTPSHGTNQARP